MALLLSIMVAQSLFASTTVQVKGTKVRGIYTMFR